MKEKKEDTKYIEMENKFKKALADYVNLEKDMDKRLELRATQQKMQIARRMLDILDALNLALKSKDELKLDEKAKSWVDGICAVLLQIEKMLNEMGITKIETKVGDLFNFSIHEAVGMVAGGEKGKISEVVFPGYSLGEYIVRPTRVIVFQGNA